MFYPGVTYTIEEIRRPIVIYSQTLKGHDDARHIRPDKEIAYEKALANGEELTEEMLETEQKIKNRMRYALEYEREQFIALKENRPTLPTLNSTDFLERVYNRMTKVHCGLITAIDLEIQEIDYILDDFDGYFDELTLHKQAHTFDELDEAEEEARNNPHEPVVIVRNDSASKS